MTNGPSLDADRLAANLRQVMDEVDAFLADATEAGEQQFDETRRKLQSQLRQMRNDLEDLQAGLSQQARRAARAADDAVHANPYAAMGLAGVAGLLLGLLVSRR